MEKHKWIINLRNKVSSLAAECDSAAAINGARMTPAEREHLQNLLRQAVEYIDKKLWP